MDPTASKDNGCGANANYGYGSGVASGVPFFSILAILENANG